MPPTAKLAEEGRPAVELTDVHKVYHLGEPVPVLDGISLSIPAGSHTAIMGPSGSGKSTLLNLVGCLDAPTTGTVTLAGRDVSTLGERARADIRGNEIGFVFQTFNLMPRLTARENVELPMVLRGVGRERRRRRARELLEEVGLAERVDHRPNELSGGQRQRVSIARAMANEPTLILADEPTGNLDTETGATVLDVLEDLQRQGVTLVVVTHERPVAERAEKIIHLLDGTVEHVEAVGPTAPDEGAWIS